MAKSYLPVQTLSHQKERVSRNEFNKVVHPWIARQQNEDDYGIDVNVEITVPNFNLKASKDRNVTGKFFNVQLKASEVKHENGGKRTFSVLTSKINSWLDSNLPTMLCLFDTKEEIFYYRWIDKKLTNELDKKTPKWITQQSISISLLPNFKKDLSDIEKYVFNHKKHIIHQIKAGDYFAFNKEIASFLKIIEIEAERYKDSYLKDLISGLRKDLSEAIYNVTIAGESRVGKSSLMNSLIGKDVSPIGIFPTTGVPICAIPASKENCIITFEKGRDKKGKITPEFIQSYADQRENPDNKKGVELVVLNVVNPSLENGIALYDIPGLNDADTNIRVISDSILNKSNAVIYLISAAPMCNDEFILSNNMVTTLKKLKKSTEKIFLVLSKADKLSKTQLLDLKKYLLFELEKYDIIIDNNEPFIFLSTFNKFKNKRLIQSVDDLQKSIWNFLLSDEKSGIYRLLGGVNNIDNFLNKVISLNKIRLLNSDEVVKMREDIDDVKKDLIKQRSKIRRFGKELKESINKKIREEKEVIINRLKVSLQGIPLNENLYSEKEINDYLEESVNNAATYLEKIFKQKMNEIQKDYDNWIRNRLILKLNDNPNKDKQRSSTYNELTWDIKSYLSVKPSNNIFFFFAQKIEQFFIKTSELINALINGKDLERNQKIRRLTKSSSSKLDKIFKNFDKKIGNNFSSSARSILEKASKKTEIYLEKIEDNLDKKEIPLTNEEVKELNEYLASLTELKRNALSLKTKISEKVPIFLP